MNSQLKISICAISAASILSAVAPTNIAFAVGSTPAPTATSTPAPSTSPSVGGGQPQNSHKPHGLTADQKAALATALTTYKATVQSALDGANKAIADARSIRDQALAAAPHDNNVRALAFSDFRNSSNQIWSAFKSAVAAAKATYDSTVATIKGSVAK
jgi:Spy/CpxP family protein refolding chaperone